MAGFEVTPEVLSSPSPVSVMLSAWFLPVWVNMAAGQDDTLLLACLACVAFLLRRGHGVSAGLVLSLCAIKFQLFLLLPLFVFAHRLWRTAAGFCLGGAVLVLISFAAAGPRWPVDYFRILKFADSIDPIGKMPNLYGLLHGAPWGPFWISILSAAVGIAVWFTIRRSAVYYGLSITVLGSLLISLHGYLYDCLFMLPVLLILPEKIGLNRVMFVYIGLTIGMVALPLPKLHIIGQGTILVFFGYAVIQTVRKERVIGAY
jgi:hypothetical protein